MVKERKIQIAPSMLAADFSRLGEEVRRVTEAGADLIHLDVMDGHFVPNLTMGPQLVKALRSYTELPFDVHLMLTHPQEYIDTFVDAGADLITIHVEVDGQLSKMMDGIRKRGVKVGLALRPQTATSEVEPYLADVDLVLPMSVEPGFGGQSFQMNTLDKIDRLRNLIDAQGLDVDIEVDGGINQKTAVLVGRSGATILVAGTAIFGSDELDRAINTLRELASSGE
ncbi:MAG: ribulose-phosphate 3-epimerase [Candidatus Poribacteria bacterium]|nr:ribulose-phosphate 3-epimerase [Candidatus Poribacteria bacterium]